MTSSLTPVLREHLSDVDAAVKVCSGTSQPVDDAVRRGKVEDYRKSTVKLFLAYEQLKAHGNAGGPAGQLASATAWTRAHLDAGASTFLGPLLSTMATNTSVALDAAAPLTTRRNAARAVQMPMQTAFNHLDRLHGTVTTVASEAAPRHRTLALEVHAQLIDPGMIDPTASALRSVAAFVPYITSSEGQRTLAGNDAAMSAVLEEAAILCGGCAGASAKYALFAAQMLQNRLQAEPGNTVSNELCRDIESFCASDLLPAAAALTLDTPVIEQAKSSTLCDLHHAAGKLIEALAHIHFVFVGVSSRQGRKAATLAKALARLLHHPDVRRLQESSLERLLLHAGLQDAPGSVSGSSGPPDWWLVREEAGRRELCGLAPEPGAVGWDSADRTAGWLEDQHCLTVYVSLGTWRHTAITDAAVSSSSRGRSSAAGAGGGGSSAAPGGGPAAAAPAKPPGPLQVARCTARTAEAIYRLCRGQGLNGAYAPAPEWQFARSQAMMHLLDCTRLVGEVPPAEARQCLPYWLEAAAWGLALAAEAEAAMAAGEPECPKRSIASFMVAPGSYARNLVQLLTALDFLCTDPYSGLHTLSEELRRECRERLQRAGLAATLDRVLRLTFTAQDRGTEAAAILTGPPSTPRPVSAILISTGVLLLRLTALTAAAPQPAPEHRELQQKGIGEDQLGLLVTTAKRAGLLATRLEAAQAVTGGSATSADLLEQVAAAMWVLLNGSGSIIRELGARLDAQRRTSASGSGSAASPSADPWDATDARCLSEAHDVAAFSVRATCCLAAPLAQAATCKVAERKAAMRRGQWDEDAEAELREMLSQVSGALEQLAMWCDPPSAIPAAHLLACQPQRLIAASCGLLVAAGSEPLPFISEMGIALVKALLALAARRHVTDHLRGWVAAPPPQSAEREQEGQAKATEATGSGAGGSAGGAAAEASQPKQQLSGCLEGPLRAVTPHLAAKSRPLAGYVLALLNAAAEASEQPSGGGGGSARTSKSAGRSEQAATWAGNGGFVSTAASLLPGLLHAPASARGAVPEVRLPDGSWVSELVGRAPAERRATRGAAAAAAPLPPHAEVDPAAALRRLRVCGNPDCANFARAAEDELELKQCSGCRAVRYCGVNCQRVHWRGAHKGECALLREK